MVEPQRPRILLTGGTSGIGYGIAQRLITDLLLLAPETTTAGPFHTPEGLTLIITCRNTTNGAKVVRSLYEYARKKALSPPRNAPGPPGDGLLREYRSSWINNFDIQLVRLDLADSQSILTCCKQLEESQPYLTHLFLNAGGGLFTGVHWFAGFYGVFTDLIKSVTLPDYLIQGSERLTTDGVGHTWQCNVFGHYLLSTHLVNLLEKSDQRQIPRIIWTGSIEGRKAMYDPSDPQALKPTANNAYQSAKYQTGMVANALNSFKLGANSSNRSSSNSSSTVDNIRTRSFMVNPGIAEGEMFRIIIGLVMHYCMLLIFYVARFAGSRTHTINPYKAAIAFTHVGLSNFEDIEKEIYQQQPEPDSEDEKQSETDSWPIIRYSSCVTRLGKEYYVVEHPDPNASDDLAWWDKDIAEKTLASCETLSQSFSLKN